MDFTFIPSIITSITCIITCVIGIRLGQRDYSTPSVRKIREKQLFKVLLPMEKAMKETLNSTKDITTLASDLKTIINENYELVPPAIFSEYQHLINLKKAHLLELQDLLKLQLAISSFYNWLKKSLGYPYSPEEIKQKYTPIKNQTDFLFIIFHALVLSTLLVSLCIVIIMLFAAQPKSPDAFYKGLMAIVLLIFVTLAYVGFVALDYRRK